MPIKYLNQKEQFKQFRYLFFKAEKTTDNVYFHKISEFQDQINDIFLNIDLLNSLSFQKIKFDNSTTTLSVNYHSQTKKKFDSIYPITLTEGIKKPFDMKDKKTIKEFI